MPSVGFVEHVLSFEMPTHEEFIQFLGELGPVQAFVLVACGLVYMLSGWKVFKALILVNAAVLGALGGRQMGLLFGGQNMPIYGAIAGALLLAAISWPLMKFAVSLMGGLAGSFVGYAVWLHVAASMGRSGQEYAWAGALIGLIVMGLLAFVIFKATIMVLTSLQGAAMVVVGLLAMLLKYDPTHDEVIRSLTNHKALVHILILVPAIVGFVLQKTSAVQKAKKKKPPSGD